MSRFDKELSCFDKRAELRRQRTSRILKLMHSPRTGIHNSAAELPVWRSGALSTGCYCCKHGKNRNIFVGFSVVCLANESGVMVQDARGLRSVAGDAISFTWVRRQRVGIDRRLASNVLNVPFPSPRTDSSSVNSLPTAFKPRFSPHAIPGCLLPRAEIHGFRLREPISRVDHAEREKSKSITAFGSAGRVEARPAAVMHQKTQKNRNNN